MVKIILFEEKINITLIVIFVVFFFKKNIFYRI